MNQESPLVSVVIPTRFRAELACRAVRSVLDQTLENLEVIVVVDGPDPDTVNLLKSIHDPRVRTVVLESNVGGSEARNIGVSLARGRWVALLDDDDEWYPAKLTKQLDAAQGLDGSRIIIVSQYVDRQSGSDLLRPRRFPRSQQPISDFLYSDATVLGSIEGFPQTSTWVVSRNFLLEVPFRKQLKRNQDTDWVLRAFQYRDVQLVIIREPLSVFNNDVQRRRITQDPDWRDSYNWVMENRDIFTRTGLSSFLAIMCMNHAGRNGLQWRVLLSLLRDCRCYGVLTPKILWLFALYGIIYPPMRFVMDPRLRKKLVYKVTAAIY